ncbi:MAG: apolipoprotein N-acyltransferase [Actinomycetes bacterium]
MTSPASAAARAAPAARAIAAVPRPGLPAALAAVAAACGGLLTWLSFPGAGHWWLAPLGVAFAVLALRGRTARAGWWLGCLYGFAFLLPHLSWTGVYVGWFPWTALVVSQTVFYGVGGALVARVQRHSLPLRVLGTAGVWVAVEAARARVPFGGFGWGRLAFSQADAPTLGLAALGGAPVVTFVVVAAGCLLAEAAWSAVRSPLRAAAGASTALVLLLVGLAVPRPTAAEDGVLRVAGIQGNVPRAGLEFNAERRAVLDNHVAATEHLAARVAAGDAPAPDLVVWPENASDIDPLRNADAHQVIDEAVAAVHAPVLVGTLLSDDAGALRNTTIVWNPGTGPGQRYVKRHPVPFAEYVPYRAFFRAITSQVDLVRADMVGGDRVGVLDVAGTRVGDLICFEVVDDGLVRDTVRAGARLVVVQTNNATFGYTDESVQQLAMSRLRAVEQGRAVAHVSTVGVSALIMPDGSVVSSSGLFTRDVLEADLPLRSTQTLATRVGAWPELVLALGGVLVALVPARSARRRPGAADRRGTGRA